MPDRAGRVFNDQADIACAKRDPPFAVIGEGNEEWDG